MRIAIDARELRGQPTGVGRYLAGLLNEWADLPAAVQHEFILCSPTPLDVAPAWRVSTVVAGRRLLGGGTLWEQLALPAAVRSARADVLFAPAYSGPVFCPVPMVVAVHDVSFAAHPEWFGAREGARRRLLTRASARRATRVVTISEFSKSEIVRLLGVPGQAVEVGYPGAPPARNDVRSRDSVVLFVGSLFGRRHVPELIEAFGRLARRHPEARLEIVGDNRTTPRLDFAALAAATGVADRIALRSYVPEDTLAQLYARASVFVFLSDYEGFGLTPLEALSAGLPIVVLDTPVSREVYREAALYVHTPEPASIEHAVERALFDEAERARILDAATRLLPLYSWRACAEQVLDVLTTAARDNGRRA